MASHLYDPFPKYLQIRGIVLRLLRSLRVGDPLPTEEALASRFNVSRETIREAIRPFWEDGTIKRRPRLGTWLAKPPTEAVDDRLTGPFEDFASLADARIELKNSSQAVVEPTPQLRTVLKLANGERVYQIRRVRTHQGRPLVMLDAVFPERIGRRIEAFVLRGGLFVPVLRAVVDQRIHEQYQKIEAIAATADMAELLEVERGVPLLLVQRVFVDGRGRPVVLFKSHYRADLYFYTVNLPKMRASAKAAKAARKAAKNGRGTKGAARRRPSPRASVLVTPKSASARSP
jgi:GntR family transcriptional regulator